MEGRAVAGADRIRLNPDVQGPRDHRAGPPAVRRRNLAYRHRAPPSAAAARWARRPAAARDRAPASALLALLHPVTRWILRSR